MGVSYTAVLMVGKEFEEESEVAEFLTSKGIELPPDDAEEMEDGLGEYLYGNDVHGLKFERLNYYQAGDYGVLGWSPNVRDIDRFADQVKEMRQKWVELFGDEPDIIHTVRVH